MLFPRVILQKQTMKSRFFLLIALLLVTRVSSAQWVQTNGPYYLDNYLAQPLTICSFGQTIFAGTVQEGIYFTTDNGKNWIPCPKFTTDAIHTGLWKIGSYLLDESGDGLFRSTDSGGSWHLLNFIGDSYPIEAATIMGNSIFAASGGVFRSTDSGLHWTNASSGMSDSDVFGLCSLGTCLYAGTYLGFIYQSTDTGNSWHQVDSVGQNYVRSLASIGTTLLAGRFLGVFRSTDSGTTWSNPDTLYQGDYVVQFIVDDSILFAGMSGGTGSFGYRGGVLYSTDSGLTWTTIDAGLGGDGVSSIAVNDSFLFAATDAGVYRFPLSKILNTSSVSETPREANEITVYPNPVSGTANINFISQESSTANVTIFDILGNPVAVLFEGTLMSGAHSFEWNANAAPAGTYYARIEEGGGVRTVKIVKK